jgi:hypothetical protein
MAPLQRCHPPAGATPQAASTSPPSTLCRCLLCWSVAAAGPLHAVLLLHSAASVPHSIFGSTAAAASASACQSGCTAAVLVAAAGARAGPVHAALLLHSAARAPHCTCRSAAAAASTHQCRQGWLCPCRGGPWRQQGHCMQCCCFAVLLACRTALAAATRQHWPGWLCCLCALGRRGVAAGPLHESAAAPQCCQCITLPLLQCCDISQSQCGEGRLC